MVLLCCRRLTVFYLSRSICIIMTLILMLKFHKILTLICMCLVPFNSGQALGGELLYIMILVISTTKAITAIRWIYHSYTSRLAKI